MPRPSAFQVAKASIEVRDSPLASGFAKVRSQIFHLEARWKDPVTGEEQGGEGTCFAIAHLVKSRRLILATAKHIAGDVPDGVSVIWTVTDFDDHGFSRRQCVFSTDPYNGRAGEYRCHRLCDMAVLFLPAATIGGENFMAPDEPVPRVLEHDIALTEGTRVAWAGFSSLVTDNAGIPKCCYFEGSIASCHVPHNKPIVYYVDGHCHAGLSGGPVWACPYDHDEPCLFGIISTYGGLLPHDHPNFGPPGFCRFEPLMYSVGFLKKYMTAPRNK